MWEFYTPRRSNMAAISKNHITLPQSMLDLIKSDHVVLGFDRESKSILVKGQNEGLKVTNRKVLARQFLQYFNINEKGSYPCTYSEQDQGIVIAL